MSNCDDFYDFFAGNMKEFEQTGSADHRKGLTHQEIVTVAT